jgi:hypothetical protein
VPVELQIELLVSSGKALRRERPGHWCRDFQCRLHPAGASLGSVLAIRSPELGIFIGTILPCVLQPEMEPGETIIGVWDELVRGTDQQKDWRERAVVIPRILATNQPNVLEHGPGIGAALAARFVAGTGVQLTHASDALRVIATDPAAPNTVVAQRDVPVSGPDLLVMLKAKSTRFPSMPVTVARLLRVSITPETGATGSAPVQRIMTWLGPPTTSSQSCFRGVKTPRVYVRLQFEAAQTATISEIAAYAHSTR